MKKANMTMLGFTVPNQAFSTLLCFSSRLCVDRPRFAVEVTPSDNAPEGLGLIGLGPSSGSEVLAALKSSAGSPPMDRIFSQDTSIPNFITVLLGRPNDIDDTYTGELTISEILPEFEKISNRPKVPVSVLRSELSSDQDFSILLDPDGIIGPDGKAIKTTSKAPSAPPHNQSQLQVIFDTGTSLPQLPK